MKIYLYYVGRRRDPNANALADDFLERTSHYCAVTQVELRPGRADFWTRHPNAAKILLDPAGKVLDSPSFAKILGKAEMQGTDLVFVVAAADGPPPGWRSHADWTLSLSAMTFPHELARALLAEQIYRAFAVLRNHPYPRQ